MRDSSVDANDAMGRPEGQRPVPESGDFLEALLDYSRDYFRLRNFPDVTRRGYLRDLLNFMWFVKTERGTSRVSEVERGDVVDYLAKAERRGLRGATRARKLAALRSFFGFVEETGGSGTNPVKDIPRPKQEWREPRVLSEGEYARLRAAAGGDARTRAMIELFLQTGIRLSEAVGLDVSDMSLRARAGVGCASLRVDGKGRKQRTISLNSRAQEAVERYLEVRCGDEGHGPLFTSWTGRRLTGRSVERIVRSALLKAGVRGASVHTLRHTFATHTVRKGTSLRVVQEALGHSSLQTTTRYVSLARELMDEQLEANAL
jgi:site-specific recombinase XerD